jgi:tetratricopeptide (TPR) repeat protein
MLSLSQFSVEIDNVVAQVRSGDLKGALAALEDYGGRAGADKASEAYWRYHLLRFQVLGYMGEATNCDAMLDAQLAGDPPTPELAVALDILRGSSYGRRARYRESKEHLHRALELAGQLGLKSLEAEAHVRCGHLCHSMETPEESEHHFLAASEIGRTLGDRYLEAVAAAAQGKNIMRSGRFAEATEHFRGVQKTASELGERLFAAMLDCEIGWGYINQKDYDAALKSLQHAEPVLRESGLRQLYGICLADIGYVQLQQGSYAEAVAQYQKALEIAEQVGSPVLIRKWSKNIAAAYEKLGDTANHEKHSETVARHDAMMGERRAEAV